MRLAAEHLAKQLNLHFQAVSLFEQALTHRSAGSVNNERLEYLGDAVLGMVIAKRLYQRFPQASEGQLSRLRSLLVKRQTLAEIGAEIQLSKYLVMGAGELRAGGQSRDSTLADAVEALLGATYLELGNDTVERLIDHLFLQRLQKLTLELCEKDPKTRLQEHLQSANLPLPEYEVLSVSGKQHQQCFSVTCRVKALRQEALGSGMSRRKAEQDAARRLLQELEK
ncbi:MAG TPA: ribonuclease III [Gammaproteobacteria bacterium]|nr:ribonuclease III [Gammaproteobacteria bacterium]